MEQRHQVGQGAFILFLALGLPLSPWPQCQAFDPNQLWQLSPTSAGNPQEVSVRRSLEPVYCYLQWSNFCTCSWPLQKWWQTFPFIRRGDIQVWIYCSQSQSPFSRCWQVLAKMLSDTKTDTTIPLPRGDVSMQQGWALAVPPALNGHGFCVAPKILFDFRVSTIHWAMAVAQMVKNLSPMQGTQFQSLCHVDPLDKRMAPTLVFLWRRILLCGEFHGQRSLVGCSPCGHKETDTNEWLTLSQFTHHSSPKYTIL